MKKASTLSVFLLLLLPPISLTGQYKLPRADVLANAGVQSIRVSKRALEMRFPDNEPLTREPLDTTPGILARFFINSSGTIDSVYRYPTEDGYYEKQVFRYDTTGQVMEFMTVSQTGDIKGRSLVEKTPDGGLYSRHWEYGQLKSESWATADSIRYKSVGYTSSGYSIYTYDLERDIRTDTYYDEDSLVIQRKSYQWIAENGMPTRLIFTLWQRGEEGKNTTNQLVEYSMDENGQVINDRNGTIFDPFRSFGYDDRHQRYTGIRTPYTSYFTEERLVTEKESEELFRYDGTTILYRYEFDYE